MRKAIYGFAAALAFSITTPAEAAITINFTEGGGDVVAVTSGTFDLTGLSLVDTVMILPGVTPNTGSFSAVSTAVLRRYSGLTGPTNFGTGGFLTALSGAGDPFYLSPTEGVVGLEAVISGPLSATTTWSNQTFASMGLTSGTYVFSTPADTIMVNIGPVDAAVPEPSSWLLMLFGFAAVGYSLRRRRTALLQAGESVS